MARRRSRRQKGLKDLVHLWTRLFDAHCLLTSAAAIALQLFVAMVALASSANSVSVKSIRRPP